MENKIQSSGKNVHPSWYVKNTESLSWWTSVTVCSQCGFRAHYKDAHPVEPCFNCGGKVQEAVGRWEQISKKFFFGLFGKEEGRWILLGEERLSSGWINPKHKMPTLLKDEDFSETVWTTDGKFLHVMRAIYVDADDAGAGLVWANCYGNVFNEAEFDDDYKVIAWMPMNKPVVPDPIFFKGWDSE